MTRVKIKSAIYPGTFDPFTLGHLDLINRSLVVFDKVIVAVADSSEKKPLFSVEKRVELIRESISDLEGVEVESFNNLLSNFCEDRDIYVVIRGLRAVSDFEYELQMSQMNRKLNDRIEMVFLMPSEEYNFISSRLTKEVASYGGDVSCFVPSRVAKALKEKFNTGR